MTMSPLKQSARGEGGGVHDASCTGPADRCHRRRRRLGSVDFRVGVESAVAVLRDGAPTQVAAPSLSDCCACTPPSGALFMPGACRVSTGRQSGIVGQRGAREASSLHRHHAGQEVPMSKPNLEALAARLDVQAIVLQELTRVLKPAQARPEARHRPAGQARRERHRADGHRPVANRDCG